MKLQITEVHVSKTGTGDKGPWTSYGVTFADGTKASTFDNAIANKTGCLVDVEFEPSKKNPQFQNIKSWILAGPVPQPTGKATEASKPQPPIQHDPRNRSMCLSYAKDIEVALISKDSGMGVNGIIDMAKEFEKYLNG